MKARGIILLTILLHITGCDFPKDEKNLNSTQVSPTHYQEASIKLQEKLALKIKENATQQDIQVMASSAEALAALLPNPGLTIGETAPEFTLQNAFGDSFTLSDQLKQGPVVLVFYRGSWCPFCNLHLHALQSIVPQLKACNAQLIAVAPQKPDETAKELKKKGYPFEVLSDASYSVAKDYNVYFEVQADLLSVYKKFGIDLEVANGEGRTGLPIPATFVLDQKGIVQAAHAETDYKNRMEPAAVLAAVEKMCG